MGSKPTT